MPHTITIDCTGCTACVRICPVEAIAGERHSVHQIESTICIDCGACGLICPVDAILDERAVKILHARRALWKKPEIIPARCISCGVCLQSCPVNCLGWGQPDPASRRALPVLFKPALCIACAFCQADCPVDAIRMVLPASQSPKDAP
jgi:ferredoxin